MKYRILPLILLIISCGNNHIVERAAEDYFPMRTDYWWRYASENDTLLVEVEPVDTLLQVECFPVSYNGAVRYLAKSDNAISQYVRKTYNYAGNDHIVLENFIIRIELPLIKGNTYQYYLADSIYVADQLIRAHYETIGNVVDFIYETEYGDLYEVNTITIESLITPDTAIVDTSTLTEFYAPDVGMIRFTNGTIEYHLIEHNIP
jgi:hypothetical protein